MQRLNRPVWKSSGSMKLNSPFLNSWSPAITGLLLVVNPKFTFVMFSPRMSIWAGSPVPRPLSWAILMKGILRGLYPIIFADMASIATWSLLARM